MTKLDLNLLEALIALDDKRSVSGAAIQMDASQPAMSAALARLRESLGDPLFVRSGNVMEPTPRATAAARAARSVLARIHHEIVADVAFDPATTQRTFTFALTDAGEIIFLPAILQALQARAPHAQVRSVSLPASGVADGLEAGEIDLAIGYFPDLKKNNFFVQTLFADTFASVLRASHPLEAPRLTMKQFLQLGHAVVHAESRTEEVIERYLTRQKIQRRVVLITPHFASVPVIVAQSDLLVTIPRPVAQYFAAHSADVRLVGLPFAVPDIEIKQLWHRKFHHDARNKWLRTLIAELFQGRRKKR